MCALGGRTVAGAARSNCAGPNQKSLIILSGIEFDDRDGNSFAARAHTFATRHRPIVLQTPGIHPAVVGISRHDLVALAVARHSGSRSISID